jgi:hypothetical protein
MLLQMSVLNLRSPFSLKTKFISDLQFLDILIWSINSSDRHNIAHFVLLCTHSYWFHTWLLFLYLLLQMWRTPCQWC